MVDTTDQQAVTVAQEAMTRPGYVVWHSSEEDGGPDVGITVGLGDGKMLWVGERTGREGDGMGLMVYSEKAVDANASVGEYDEIRDLLEQHVAPALSRLASVSSARAEGFVVVPREPTEAMLDAYWRQTGESTEMRTRTHAYMRRYWSAMLAVFPEPVPATNQAGEVERSDDEVIAEFAFLYHAYGIEADDKLAPDALELKRKVLAALATQPATSQEGEQRKDSDFAWSVPRHATEAMMQAGLYHCSADMQWADLFTAWHYMVNAADDADQVESGGPDGYATDGQVSSSTFPTPALAATPTPPTLSEDLREALEPFAMEADRQERTTTFSSGDSVILRTKITIGQLRRARAALAQVKAS